MNREIIYGFIVGLIVAVCMRFIPVFHGPNSNIIKTKEFFDSDKNTCYTLSPYIVNCE